MGVREAQQHHVESVDRNYIILVLLHIIILFGICRCFPIINGVVVEDSRRNSVNVVDENMRFLRE